MPFQEPASDSCQGTNYDRQVKECVDATNVFDPQRSRHTKVNIVVLVFDIAPDIVFGPLCPAWFLIPTESNRRMTLNKTSRTFLIRSDNSWREPGSGPLVAGPRLQVSLTLHYPP
ncbi:hypothetical protein BaRGS_00029495 [Batillaria attramentaria]|uniref:Uncharacterized protein n=1 Tax=Batillaria attramentaria TaxID=370345 RepID=A0ABD0JWA6_9CAEN